MKDEIYKDSDVIIEDSAKGSTDKGAADGYDSYEEKACVEHAHGTKRSVWITDSAPVAMLEPMNATESRRPATARMQARCSTKEQRDRSVAVAYDTQQHAGNEQSPCACSDVRAYDSYRMQVSDHCWEPNTLFPAETACMDAVLEPMNARGWWRSRRAPVSGTVGSDPTAGGKNRTDFRSRQLSLFFTDFLQHSRVRTAYLYPSNQDSEMMRFPIVYFLNGNMQCAYLNWVD
ncbi:hypothetical protein EV421DRAFT_1737507 [Armillaria borealis]|uniref:Uncharacterized protein n=1 Tax=Armillaria borealis TaxID=47425 RepID=A0AA39JGK9_9AGAR|nr:hypothetical protein EV421DRAFT_1737507 [Armillaria borealis]